MAKTKRKVAMPSGIRSKLTAAVAMLLVSLILLVSSTYAWFTLSTAPEVKNITTTVAGNGSLEIALMPQDGLLGSIKNGLSSTVGGGTVDIVTANTTWGNLVDLSDLSYGLVMINLNPAALDINADGTFKDPAKPIAVPVFGGDGRIEKTASDDIALRALDTASQQFTKEKVYGVRAITEVVNGIQSGTYGYVVDLAFRLNTNAVKGDTVTDGKLLLQTAAKQRIYTDSTNADTLGGGSYMEFSTVSNNLTPARVQKLMEAIRITFVQDYGKADGKADGTPTILGTARLDTAGMTGNKAPLYLYSAAGEKLEGETAVLLDSMPKNAAQQVSAVVWLDGNQITNADVAATELQSMSGTLNLQFTTDIALSPVVNTPLKGVEAGTTAESSADIGG